MISFEDYLCNRNDAIDNAAYQLICAMTAQDHNELKEDDPAVPDWNMEIIGELVDAAEEIIQEKAGHTCHHSTATVFLVIRLEIAKISIALSYRLTQRRETCEEPRGFRLVLQDQERRDQ